jgi:transcriptional regulator with XRE-family HTH domain
MTTKTKKIKNIKSTDETLGSFIKRNRMARGLSQAELSLNLGYMSPQFISDWERGISSPPIKKLPELASLLKVKVDIIFNLLVKLSIEQLEDSLNSEFKKVKKKT